MEEELQIKFKQKKVNHVFHYTKRYEWLQKILNNGFAPSYCYEKIGENEFYIPMVSFCNISLGDVDDYMRYGKYGIGMSMEWAVKNGISPVIYIHEKTPFRNFHLKFQQLNKTHNISLNLIPFMKNWKAVNRGNDIITYHEREWRFVPKLEEEQLVITRDNSKFNDFLIKNKIKKPHLPNNVLYIEELSEVKYITVKNDKQRGEILELLYKRFTRETVSKALVSGLLFIFTEDQLHNDF